MQPTGFVLEMVITAERPDRAAPVGNQGGRQLVIGGLIARPLKVDKPGPAQKSGAEFICCLANDHQHCARTTSGR